MGQLARDQVKMANEAKFRSLIHSTFEALVMWYVVQSCHGKELGPFCWSMPASGITVFDASHQFAENTSRMWWFRWDSENCSGSDQRQTTKQWPWLFFSARLASWSALELLLSPTTELVIVGCCIKSIFHRTSQSNEEIVHCCCLEEKMTLQNDHFFFICSQLMKHPLIELFHLSNLFQMPNVCRMVDGEFFGSFTCSCMRISFHDAFN